METFRDGTISFEPPEELVINNDKEEKRYMTFEFIWINT